MSEKIRIGIMGFASIAKRLMIPAILKSNDIFELVAIASRDSEKVREDFNNPEIDYLNYEELIERNDISAIYMPLPTGLHEEWATKALLKKKHLLVEKSFAMDYLSAQKIIELAAQQNCVVMENFMFCHHSQHRWIKEMLSSDSIGKTRVFRSQFGFPPLEHSNFRYNKEMGGGALLDAGAYTIKASQMFFGNQLEVESAVLYVSKETGVDMYGNVTLIDNEGIVCQLSFGFDNHYQCNYEFWGSKGTLVAKKAFTPKPEEKPVVLLDTAIENKIIELEPDNHFVKILKAFHTNITKSNYQYTFNEILAQSLLLNQVRNKAKIFYI